MNEYKTVSHIVKKQALLLRLFSTEFQQVFWEIFENKTDFCHYYPG